MSENTPAVEDTNEVASLIKPPGLARRCSRGISVGLCYAIGTLLRPFQSRSLTISKETTFLTEPLKSDGRQVDYFMAMRQAVCLENVATDDNGYRLLVRHLGRDPESEPAYFARVCEQLGLDADALQPDMPYEDPETFLEAYVKSDEFNERLLDALPPEQRSKEELAKVLGARLWRPWTYDELPMMARWLEENSPALDLLGQAVCKTAFHIPWVREDEQEQVAMSLCGYPFIFMRSLARGPAARARFRIAQGDIDRAIDDIVACKRLGRCAGRRPAIVDLLVGMAIEGIADAVGIAGSLAHRPTKRQIQRLLDEPETLPPAPNVTDTVFVERLCALDGLQWCAHTALPWKEEPLVGNALLACLTALGVEWNVVGKRFIEAFNAGLAAGGRVPDVSLTVSRILSFASIKARSRYVADALCNREMCPVQACNNLLQRSTCLRQMRRITLAMLLYECDHGTLPPAWSVDGEGNPLHSWRVLLLPYLGRQALFERIRLDQPWDSEHNRQFHNEEVAVYRCPSHPAAGPGQATYTVVVGPDMPFEAGQGKRLADFGPYSDDMILLAERAVPVCWMDPTHEVRQTEAEQGFDDDSSPPPAANRIQGFHAPHTNFGFRSGVAQPIYNGIDRDLFGKLLRGTNAEKDRDAYF